MGIVLSPVTQQACQLFSQLACFSLIGKMYFGLQKHLTDSHHRYRCLQRRWDYLDSRRLQENAYGRRLTGKTLSYTYINVKKWKKLYLY
jgi:hypothetical protein